jgi:hypothetical protein
VPHDVAPNLNPRAIARAVRKPAAHQQAEHALDVARTRRSEIRAVRAAYNGQPDQIVAGVPRISDSEIRALGLEDDKLVAKIQGLRQELRAHRAGHAKAVHMALKATIADAAGRALQASLSLHTALQTLQMADAELIAAGHQGLPPLFAGDLDHLVGRLEKLGGTGR